jgi:hypothetical protein
VKVSPYRLLGIAVSVDVIALVLAFALRHAKHGASETVGAIGWFTLLADTLLVLVLVLALALAVLVRVLRGRRPTQPAIR